MCQKDWKISAAELPAEHTMVTAFINQFTSKRGEHQIHYTFNGGLRDIQATYDVCKMVLDDDWYCLPLIFNSDYFWE